MGSKELLNNMCNMCEKKMLEDKKLCPWRRISNDYCDEYENIKQYLDKLEEQVSTLDNSVNNLLLDLDIAREENNKLKMAIEILKDKINYYKKMLYSKECVDKNLKGKHSLLGLANRNGQEIALNTILVILNEVLDC